MSLKDRFGPKSGSQGKKTSQDSGPAPSPLERYLAKKREAEQRLAKNLKTTGEEKKSWGSLGLEEKLRTAADKAKKSAKGGFDSVLKGAKPSQPPPLKSSGPRVGAGAATGVATAAGAAAGAASGTAGEHLPPQKPPQEPPPPPPSSTPLPNLPPIDLTVSRAEPAPLFPRFVALVVDWLIVSTIDKGGHKALMNVLNVLLGDARASYLSDNVATFVYLVTAFLYFGWFYSQRGATPGKLILDLEVATEPSGARLGYWRAFFRETVGKFLSLVPLAMGFVLAAVRTDRRALHDLIFETRVIRRRSDALSDTGSKGS